MWKITKTYVWASGLACLAVALGAAGAFAQQQQGEEQQQGQQYESQRQPSDDEPQSDEQQQRARQQQQQSQQDQQQVQQEQQRSQQEQQRAQRDQQRSRQEQQRAEQRQRDQQRTRDQYGRESQRTGRSGDREAGLGVQVESDQPGSVRVVRVHRDSPAEEMGLQQGDRITLVNGQQVQSERQFITQIRNMSPGDEIELQVTRDDQERTVRGELKSRQEALAMRTGIRSRGWQEGGDTWQTGYEERGQGRMRGDADRQLNQIERQVNRLSREIEEIRYALRDLRQQSGRWDRETTAQYEEYQRGPGEPRTTGRWQDEERSRQFDGPRGQRQGERGRQSDQFNSEQRRQSRESDGQQGDREGDQGQSRTGQSSQSRQSESGQRDGGEYDQGELDSPGGEIGEERTRTGSEIQDTR